MQRPSFREWVWKMKQITVLLTADLHGQLFPWDYALNQRIPYQGLACAASAIEEIRQNDPATLLFDTGDFFQGAASDAFGEPGAHPLLQAMNDLNYDGHTLGNHELDFGFQNTQAFIAGLKAPVLAANIYTPDGKRWLKPYFIRHVNGVRIAVFGLASPHTPAWLASYPQDYGGLRFTDPAEECAQLIPELNRQAEVIIGLCHFGLKNGSAGGCARLAEEFPQIDLLLAGHDHHAFIKKIGHTTIIEAACQGITLGKAEIRLKALPGGGLEKEIQAGQIEIAHYPPHPAFKKKYTYYHQHLQRAIEEPLCTLTASTTLPEEEQTGDDGSQAPLLRDLPAALVKSHAAVNLFHDMQRHYSGGQISAASYFLHDGAGNFGYDFSPGIIRRHHLYNLYPFENYVVLTNITGRHLRQYMEAHCGGFFELDTTENTPAIIWGGKLSTLDYDMLSGLEYQIHLRYPPGERIKNLRFQNRAVQDKDTLTLALSSYRHSQLLNAGWITEQDRLWDSRYNFNPGLSIRQLLGRYLQEQTIWQPRIENNWQIIC